VAAVFGMAAESGRAADLDGAHHGQLFKRKRVSFPVSRAVLSKDAGHFQSGPPHAICGALVSAL
jgi:hypothetical protein